MALFNRRKDNQVPPELEAYYDGPRWHVWVRRAVYVLVVAAVLFGIFLLGRAVYRSVTNTDSDQDTAQTQEIKKESDEQNQKGSSDTDKQNANGQVSGATDNGTAGASTTTPNGSTGQSGSTPSSIPRTGDDPVPQTTLPATGG